MLLFTYGTLRRGFRNHHFLENAKFIATAISIEKIDTVLRTTPDYPEGYPVAFISKSPKAQNLSGEIFEIDEITLSRIDKLEDYPHEYDRVSLQFECEDNITRSALIYIGKDDFDHEL